MSDPFHRDLELCNALNAFAESLDRPRDRAPSLYLAVDPFYRELEGYIQAATPDLVGRVFSDLRVRTAESGLHRLRAAYEYDKEVVRARFILDGERGQARLARLLEDESHWALGPELHAALSGRRHVLIAGSGPLPLTTRSLTSSSTITPGQIRTSLSKSSPEIRARISRRFTWSRSKVTAPAPA